MVAAEPMPSAFLFNAAAVCSDGPLARASPSESPKASDALVIGG
jgi:hypothetical protein